jgi:hypothetical protein
VTPSASGPTPIRPGQGAPARPPGASRSDLDLAVAVLRARVDEEFKIAERLDTKSRQAFALAAGFFVIAQTLAFGSGVDGNERYIVGALALIAAVVLVVAGHRLADAEETRRETDIKPDMIVEWCNTATDDDYVVVNVVSNMRDVANDRHANNDERKRLYDRVASATRWSLIWTAVELVVAIVVRI